MEYNLLNYPSLDSSFLGNNIKLLSHTGKKVLIRLIIKETLHLLSDEAQKWLAPLLPMIMTYESKRNAREIIRKHEKKRLKLLQVKTKQLLDEIHDDHRLKYWLANSLSVMLLEKEKLKNILDNEELVENFLEYYSSLIIKYGLQEHAFLNANLMGVEIEFLPVRGKRALAKTIMLKVCHLLIPTYEEPRGRLRLRGLDLKAYYRLREKNYSLLENISDDHALKLSLVNVATVLLTRKNFKDLLVDGKSVELFLRQYYESIEECLLHNQASLDGDPRVIIELNFAQKQNLTESIMHTIEHLLPVH